MRPEVVGRAVECGDEASHELQDISLWMIPQYWRQRGARAAAPNWPFELLESSDCTGGVTTALCAPLVGVNLMRVSEWLPQNRALSQSSASGACRKTEM